MTTHQWQNPARSLASSVAVLPPPQAAEMNTVSGITMMEDMQHIIHLLNFGQMLCGQIHRGIDELCQEVERITGSRARLFLHHQRTAERLRLPSTALISFPLQFGMVTYGTLCIASDPVNVDRPAFSQPMAQLLAQICSWLLYTFEQSAFVQGQCRQLDYQIHGSLTKREREVLTLMCRGHNQEDIAEILSIAPSTVGKHRQHIYDQLGVHCERDALLAAYQAGLISFIEEC